MSRAPLASFLWLRATRVANGIGWIDVRVPKSFDTSLLKRDYMIQVWRQPRGGALTLWRPYFLRKWRFQTVKGVDTLVLSGPCVNDLLRRRSVIAYSGSPWARFLEPADDMMKALVTYAQSDSIEPTPTAGTRAWSRLSVAADLGAAPTIYKDVAFDGPLLAPSGGGVLPKIAAASKEAGTDLFFDVQVSSVSASSIQLEFRTFTGQPGQDLSDYVLFDESKGNMKNAFYEYDASREANYVYGTGKGEGVALNVQQVSLSSQFASAWNRCELVADARNEDTNLGVTEVARSAVEAGRPTERMGIVPQDTIGTKYGAHWNWGDKVMSRYKGIEFISIVRSVILTIDKKTGEQVMTRLDYNSDV